MAIAFDATTQLTIVDTVSSGSVNHTVTGSNMILWCGVENNNQSGITSMTYNSVSLTQAVFFNETNGQQISLWYLIGPATGTHSFAVTRTSNSGNSWWQIASYSGAKQSGQPDATTSNSGTTATSLTTTLTTVADNTISILVGYANNASSPLTVGTNSTKVAEMAPIRSTLFDSTGVGPKTPAGSFSMTFNTDTSGTVIAAVMASFAPFVASTTKPLSLLGVG